MQPVEQGHARSLRLAVVAVALLVLLGLVAFASRSSFGHASTAAPTPAYVNWAVSIFLILFVLMIPFAVWAYSMQMREFLVQKPRSFQGRVIRTLSLILVLAVIGAGVMWFRSHGDLRGFSGLHAPPVGPLGRRGGHPGAAKPYQPTFQWPVLWVTLALLLAVAAWWWWTMRSRAADAPHDEDEQPAMAADVAATIADAIDGLEAEPDARRAVIAAYARMETVLARHGLRRRPSDTPIEYLRRVLLSITTRADAVRSLTGLFEQAKFSSHRIDDAMKQDAIAALREIRDDLQVSTK
jgi:hypothetical protein